MEYKSALITGAAAGIGRQIAYQLAEKVEKLVLVDINVEGVEQLADELRGKTDVKTYILNLRNAVDCELLAQRAEDAFGQIDVVINNAGYAHKPAKIEDLTIEEFDTTFDINVRGPFLISKGFIPRFYERKNGLVVNLASTANIRGYPDLSVYAASKAALSSITDSIALEGGDNGVKAVTILPGRTNTDMQVKVRGAEVAAKSQDPKYVAEVITKVVTGEITTKNGDDVQIINGQYLVEQNIFDKSFDDITMQTAASLPK